MQAPHKVEAESKFQSTKPIGMKQTWYPLSQLSEIHTKDILSPQEKLEWASNPQPRGFEVTVFPTGPQYYTGQNYDHMGL